MQTKNPYINQLQNLNLALENNILSPEDLCKTVLKTSKRDVMTFADQERAMLSELCTNIVNHRALHMDTWMLNPQQLVIDIQVMVAEYAEERFKAMMLKKSEFEFSEAMLDSAVHNEKGTLQ